MAGGLYGDWNKAIRQLNGMGRLMDRNLERATKKNATTLRDQMKKTIRNGWPGEAPNAPRTIARKGSSKPLIDHADMLNSINYKTPEPMTAFIGVPKMAKNREGDDLVNIAMVLVFGSKTRNIPPRDFIMVAFNLVLPKLEDRYREACKATLKGERYVG